MIDAKSGTSGAGRATGKGKEHLLYAEASGSFLAYGVGSHRHMPEIEQGLVEVRCCPHLAVPCSFIYNNNDDNNNNIA